VDEKVKNNRVITITAGDAAKESLRDLGINETT